MEEVKKKKDVRKIVYTVISLVLFAAWVGYTVYLMVEMAGLQDAQDWSGLAIILLLPLQFVVGIAGAVVSFIFSCLAFRRIRLNPSEKHPRLQFAFGIVLVLIHFLAYIAIEGITILLLQ